VGLGAAAVVVPDRPQKQLALEYPKRSFDVAVKCVRRAERAETTDVRY
jgi:hypothetical protein